MFVYVIRVNIYFLMYTCGDILMKFYLFFCVICYTCRFVYDHFGKVSPYTGHIQFTVYSVKRNVRLTTRTGTLRRAR